MGDAEGCVLRGGPFGGRQWVVGRGECQYRREDLHQLPARKRMQAGKLAMIRHKPSPSALSCMAWTGGIAHFWFWAAPEAEVPAYERNWIPESLLLAPPAAGGVRLLELSRGYEAQNWHGGVLVSSQWWEQVPGAEAWMRFVRSTGQDPAALQEVPQPIHLPWSNRPWGETSWAQRLAGLFDEKFAWLLLFAALAAGLGWQLSSLLRWQAAGDQLSVRVERMRAEVGPLLAAREQAEQAQAQLQHLSALRTSNDDYLLMADMASHLPEGSTLLNWRREANKLQTTVRSSETDPRAFVIAFDADPRLSGVAVKPLANGVMQLAFELPAGTDAGADPKGAGHE
ncbi:hypothetical protein ACSBPQ_12300 [Stenotrophomonas sp. JC08]|uniref:hypothetical protein n=1 Tax=Stenotrophomonas sp. JC08 TaxID=3445779 RepID=UPI003FA27F30